MLKAKQKGKMEKRVNWPWRWRRGGQGATLEERLPTTLGIFDDRVVVVPGVQGDHSVYLGEVEYLLNRFATAALVGLTDGGGLWGALELGCSPLYWVHSGTGSAGGVGSLSRTPRGPGGNSKCKKNLCLRRS